MSLLLPHEEEGRGERGEDGEQEHRAGPVATEKFVNLNLALSITPFISSPPSEPPLMCSLDAVDNAK